MLSNSSVFSSIENNSKQEYLAQEEEGSKVPTNNDAKEGLG